MIFKVQKRPKRVNGKRILSQCYYLRYRFGDMLVDRWKSLGVADKEVANEIAREFRREWEAELQGILLPKAIRSGAKKPLREHLDDYLSDLRQRGKSGRRDKGIKQTESRLMRLVAECAWQFPANVTPDSFVTWRSAQQGLSPRTLNHYLQELLTFLNWLERNGRITINPLRTVSKVDESGRQTRQRRALSDDELARLLAVAPEYRRLVYLTAARSGLRYQELRALEWRDIVFSGEDSHIHARASTTKNKKAARLPLVKELEAALLAYKPEDAEPSDRVFRNGVPRAYTLVNDLKAAGIPHQDELGRYADFHSLRYTWGTFLQRNGVSSRVAMELMRHSDRKLTDKIYTDSSLLPLAEAVRGLPELPQVSHIRAQICGKSGQNVSQRGIKKTPAGVSEVFDIEEVCRPLSHPVRGGLKLEVAGVEPASPEFSRAVSPCSVYYLASLFAREQTR